MKQKAKENIYERDSNRRRALPSLLFMLLFDLHLHESSLLVVDACDHVPFVVEKCVELHEPIIRTRQTMNQDS